MQILSGLARTYGGAVEYPDAYVEFTRGMSFVNFDLAYAMPFAHCSLSLPYQSKLIIHMITPIAFWVSVQLGQFFAVQLGKGKKSAEKLLAQSNVGGTIVIQLGMLLCV